MAGHIQCQSSAVRGASLHELSRLDEGFNKSFGVNSQILPQSRLPILGPPHCAVVPDRRTSFSLNHIQQLAKGGDHGTAADLRRIALFAEFSKSHGTAVVTIVKVGLIPRHRTADTTSCPVNQPECRLRPMLHESGVQTVRVMLRRVIDRPTGRSDNPSSVEIRTRGMPIYTTRNSVSNTVAVPSRIVAT